MPEQTVIILDGPFGPMPARSDVAAFGPGGEVLVAVDLETGDYEDLGDDP